VLKPESNWNLQTFDEFVQTVDSCNIDLDAQEKKRYAPIKIRGERKVSYNISGSLFDAIQSFSVSNKFLTMLVFFETE
jgi:hypothetical protein